MSLKYACIWQYIDLYRYSLILSVVFILSTLYSPTEAATVQNKQFLPKEALVYIRLVKFALQALDIYTINIGANGQAVIRPAV